MRRNARQTALQQATQQQRNNIGTGRDQESNLYAEDDRDDNDIYDDVEEFGLEDEYNEDIPNNDV